ncbi:MAG: hypothetical protein Q9163_005809 [Psora crenata]
MVVLNAAFLSLLLPAAVLAWPNAHERLHHKRQGVDTAFSAVHPSGIHGGPPIYNASLTHSSASVRYSTANQTQSATTASSPGVGAPGGPVTIQSTLTVVPIPATVVPTTASTHTSDGSAESGQGASTVKAGVAPGGESGEHSSSGANCGPATVTVTSGNTVTVTVTGAAGGQTSTSSPLTVQTSVQGDTTENGNGGLGTQPLPTQPPATVQHPAAPKQEPTGGQYQASQQLPPAQPQQSPEQSQQKPSPASSQSQPQQSQERPQEQPQQPDKVQARGILYTSLPEANSLAGVGWGCNWDSSPIPAIGQAKGSLNYQFVPQLWGPVEPHIGLWTDNSAGYVWVMAFNEPNIDKAHGGCGPMEPGDAVAKYETLMQPNRDAGQKIVSPCVSNDRPDWLDTFIGRTSLTPDAVCFHWYGMSLSELKNVVKQFEEVQKKHNIAELWMTEWAFTTQVSAGEMDEVLRYLDSSSLNRYAYNTIKLDQAPALKAVYLS